MAGEQRVVGTGRFDHLKRKNAMMGPEIPAS